VIGIVIVAHGGLAREYLAALEHVVGKRPGTVAVSIAADDDSRSKQAEIAAAVASVDQGQGVVVVTDMFGSTPSNLAIGACRRPDRTVVYGVNMPLLVQLSQSRRMSLKEAVAAALTAGRKYINCIDGLRPNGSSLAL
jgi:PTS system mannose-specific IIA component